MRKSRFCEREGEKLSVPHWMSSKGEIFSLSFSSKQLLRSGHNNKEEKTTKQLLQRDERV